MKNNMAYMVREDEGRMRHEFDIIRGAINCDYTEIDNALNEDPICVNSQNQLGLTAAHFSVSRSNYGVLIRLAQEEKFDPFVTDNFNRRAIDCANRPEMQKFRKLLMHKMYGVFPELARELEISKP